MATELLKPSGGYNPTSKKKISYPRTISGHFLTQDINPGLTKPIRRMYYLFLFMGMGPGSVG